MRSTAVACLLLMLILLAIGCGDSDAENSNGDKQVVLRLNLRKGARLRQWSTSEQKILRASDYTPIIEQTIGIGTTYEVIDVGSDGSATVRITYDSVSYSEKSGEMVVEYRSGDTVVPEPAIGYDAMFGQTFVVRFSATGGVLGLYGLDSVRSSITERLGQENEFLQSTVKQGLMTMFADSALHESFEQLFAIYPDHPVGIGDSWTVIGGSRNLPIRVENRYTLASISDSHATLDVDGTIVTPANAPPVDAGALVIGYALEGTQRGKQVLDLETGWTIQSDVRQEMEGTLSTSIRNGTSAPKEIEVRIVAHARVEQRNQSS